MSTETANPPVAPAAPQPAAPAATPEAPKAAPAPVNRGYKGGAVPDSVRAAFKPDTPFVEKPPADATPPPEPAPKPAAPAPAPEPKVVAMDPDEAPTPSVVSKFLPKKAAPSDQPAAPTAPSDPGSSAPEDLIEIPEGKSPRSEQWKQVKAIAKSERARAAELEQRAKSLEAQLQASKVTPPDGEAVEKLRSEHKAMSDRLMLVDLREHPSFRQQFVEPKNHALAEASNLLKANGVEGVNVAELLNRPRAEFGKAVSEAGAKLNDFDRVDFAERMRKAWELENGAKSALEKSRETYQALSGAEQSRQRAAFEKTWAKTAGLVSEHIVELEVPPTANASERAKIESYNRGFKNLRVNAEKIALAPLAPEEVSTAAIKAAAYDFHLEHVMPQVGDLVGKMQDQIRGLTAQLQAIRSKNPNADRNHAPAIADGAPDPSQMSHDAAAEYYSKR